MTTTTPRGSISPKVRLVLFERAEGRRHICERRIRAGELWELEHVIPLALGGKDSPANMAPAHKACHAEKTRADNTSWSKAKRMKAKHLGIRRSGQAIPGSKASGWRHRMNGDWVRR